MKLNSLKSSPMEPVILFHDYVYNLRMVQLINKADNNRSAFKTLRQHLQLLWPLFEDSHTAYGVFINDKVLDIQNAFD